MAEVAAAEGAAVDPAPVIVQAVYVRCALCPWQDGPAPEDTVLRRLDTHMRMRHGAKK